MNMILRIAMLMAGLGLFAKSASSCPCCPNGECCGNGSACCK